MGKLPLQPTYKATLVRWAVCEKRLNYAEFLALAQKEKDWWVSKSFLTELNDRQFGSASHAAILDEFIRAKDADTARVAASHLIENGYSVAKPYRPLHRAARLPLRVAGKIVNFGRLPSLIPDVLEYVLKTALPSYQWEKLLGANHLHAQRVALTAKQAFETDPDAFVVRLDSLTDLLFKAACDKIIPTTSYNYGSLLNAPPGALRSRIGVAVAGFKTLHDLRVNSMTAHPRSRATGRPTRRLKVRDFARIRLALGRAFLDLIANVPP